MAKTENDSDAAVESAQGWSCMVAAVAGPCMTASAEEAGASDGGVASMEGKDGGSVVETCKPAAEFGACEQEVRDNHVTVVVGAGHAAVGRVCSSTEGVVRESVVAVQVGGGVGGGGGAEGVHRRLVLGDGGTEVGHHDSVV